MGQNVIRLMNLAVGAGFFAAIAAQADLVRNPTRLGASIDLGQIVAGEIYKEFLPTGRADGQVITRTGVYLTESGVYNDRLTIRLTIGGLFWFALPEETAAETRRVLFGPGVGEAQGQYAFGADPANPTATVQFGLFPHKYSDAVNLGEYLYRSGTYSGYLVTGGWSYLNSASYLAQGVRVNVPMLDGMLQHDFTLYMERDIEPAHDISPGYMLTVKPTGFLEVGVGTVWAHGLPLNKSSELTPERLQNAYDKSSGRPSNADTSAVNACRDAFGALDTAAQEANCGYYTFKGFKAMGRASADLGMLLGLQPNDFKVYTEVALLGVKDYPGFFDDKMERMPVLVGANLPTFGILDRLTVEMEYRKTRFPNTIGAALADQLPLPIGQTEDFYLYPEAEEHYKWTVYAKRQIVPGVSITAQAANDHLRHFSSLFAIPAHRPSTERNQDWYYVARLEFGI